MKVSNNTSQPVSSTQTQEAAAAKKARAPQHEEAVKLHSVNRDMISDSAKPEISEKAKDAAKAKAIAAQAPDVREAKIAELKKRIAEGKYQVNPEALADRMVDEHLKTNLD